MLLLSTKTNNKIVQTDERTDRRVAQVQIRKFYELKIVIIFLPINLNMCLGAQKNHLIEMVLLSTHNICFG